MNNLLNPTLINIKIDCANYNNTEIFNIMQFNDDILIFSGCSSYFRLVQIESKSFKIIKTIDMSLYITSFFVNEGCKLSNGQLDYSLHNNNFRYESIALLVYDDSTKNLIYYYNFSFNKFPIYKIIEMKIMNYYYII